MQQLERRKSNKVLVVSAGPAITAKWLAPRLYRFVRKHPDIDARISSSITKVDLETDDVDVVITAPLPEMGTAVAFLADVGKAPWLI